MDNVRNVFNPLYQKIVFSDGLRHAKHIGLLECVATNEVPRHLPGNCHNRGRVHVGRSKACNKIGSAGTTSGYAHANLTRGASVAVGGVSCCLLVPHEDM